MEITQRRKAILLAVIEGYMNKGLPVSSKWLFEHYRFGSSATIRNEMLKLERLGLLAQPHTSAGRVPTDSGYRFYVESINDIGALGTDEKIFLKRFFRMAGGEMDELMDESSHILAEMTKCLSIITAPMLQTSRFKHMEIVKLSSAAAMMVLITDTGRVEKSVFGTGNVTAERLDDIADKLNRVFSGLRIQGIKQMVNDLLMETVPEDFVLFKSVITAVVGSIELDDGKVFIQGIDNLSFFSETEKVRRDAIAGLVKKAMNEDVIIDYLVRIGSENESEELEQCTLIARRYGVGGVSNGLVGVVGPKRMNYQKVLSLVDYAARSLSEKLNSVYS